MGDLGSILALRASSGRLWVEMVLRGGSEAAVAEAAVRGSLGPGSGPGVLEVELQPHGSGCGGCGPRGAKGP